MPDTDQKECRDCMHLGLLGNNHVTLEAEYFCIVGEFEQYPELDDTCPMWTPAQRPELEPANA